MQYRPQIIVTGLLFILLQVLIPGTQHAMAFAGGMFLSFGMLK